MIKKCRLCGLKIEIEADQPYETQYCFDCGLMVHAEPKVKYNLQHKSYRGGRPFVRRFKGATFK